MRTKFESTLLQLDTYTRKVGIRAASCFVSYAWGNALDERWVEKQLATDLKKARIDVILDRWVNSAIGSNVGRFISLIDKCDRIVVVGTPLYRKKYENKVFVDIWRDQIVTADFWRRAPRSTFPVRQISWQI